MSFKEFVHELNGNRVEGELVKSIIYSLLTSIIALGILYYFAPGSFSKYGLYLFLAGISYAVIVPTIHHVRAYKEMNCMCGMMIGMSSGMIAGFLPGFYVAATNGMFFGGFFGVSLGIIFGVWNGKCCGVMGIMEGIMAGFMGGLMGAMTAFMLLNDHLQIAAILVLIICSFIAFGLNYMIFKEAREMQRQREENHLLIVFITFALITLTALMMIYGWKGGIFA